MTIFLQIKEAKFYKKNKFTFFISFFHNEKTFLGIGASIQKVTYLPSWKPGREKESECIKSCYTCMLKNKKKQNQYK